jgi:predicted DNA-binding transcriptional regulator AlpA
MDQPPSKPTNRVGRNKPQYVPDDPLLMAREAAAELGIGLSTLYRDVAAGRLPQPYYLTPRAPRWRRSELRAVVAARRMSKTIL